MAKMVRMVSLLLIVIFALAVLGGCGSKAPAKTADTPASETSKKATDNTDKATETAKDKLVIGCAMQGNQSTFIQYFMYEAIVQNYPVFFASAVAASAAKLESLPGFPRLESITQYLTDILFFPAHIILFILFLNIMRYGHIPPACRRSARIRILVVDDYFYK